MDLTLTDRFGYNRKTPFKHQVDNCQVKNEIDDAATKRGPGESCWEEIDWHKRRMEEQQEATEDSTNDGIFSEISPTL